MTSMITTIVIITTNDDGERFFNIRKIGQFYLIECFSRKHFSISEQQLNYTQTYKTIQQIQHNNWFNEFRDKVKLIFPRADKQKDHDQNSKFSFPNDQRLEIVLNITYNWTRFRSICVITNIIDKSFKRNLFH